MRILRSKGTSYTNAADLPLSRTAAQPVRGLRLAQAHPGGSRSFEQVSDIPPVELAHFIRADCDLVLRQGVSAIDKIIRKRPLKNYNVEAYVDRVKLSDALWRRLSLRLLKSSLEPSFSSSLSNLRQTWDARVHPYARCECNTVHPHLDGNAQYIAKHADGSIFRSEFEGRWHKAFWRHNGNDADYAAIAEALERHLFEQELTISGRERRIDGQNGGTPRLGLAESRGHSMALSARDPRAGKKYRRDATWTQSDEDAYFGQDVARHIADTVEGEAASGAVATGARIGAILYDHYGAVCCHFADDENANKRFWSLHNAVRQFYQRLTRTERYRCACRSGSRSEVRTCIPGDREALLRAMGAKRRNASVSELIRLGKLIVHASDIGPRGLDPQPIFQRNMAKFLTSDGQSEIKRHEAFARVWRNAIGLSLRTARAWFDPEEQASVSTGGRGKPAVANDDLASTKVAAQAVLSAEPKHLTRLTRHAALVFGDKLIAGRSRASIFQAQSEAVRREVAWAMLRLVGELRDRTHHFCTKPRLLKAVGSGLLRYDGSTQKARDEWAGDQAAPEVDAVLTALLTFDIDLQRHALVDDLNRLGTSRYVYGHCLQRLIEELSGTRSDTATAVPKFMSVLRKVSALAKGSVPLHANIARFGEFDLSGLSKHTAGHEHFQIGVLRLLYHSGFVAWLEHQRTNTALIQDCYSRVLQAKESRSEQYRRDRGQYYHASGSLVADLATGAVASLEDLFRVLLSRSVQAERDRNRYNGAAKRQGHVSNWVEAFKQEFYAHLFAVYLVEQELLWIWDIGEPISPEDDTPIEPDEIVIPHSAVLAAIEPWHAQFYAWLYLVPSDDVALLRHQFRKTTILEAKASASEVSAQSEALRDIDWLMGLYVRVQSAGFSGKEHLGQRDLKALLYERPDFYETVYSERNEDHHVSFPGTRRGLRQILRFGHYRVLEGIFEKHKITAEEVDAFTKLDAKETKVLFERRTQLRERIEALVNDRDAKPEHIEQIALEYRSVASNVALYNFRTNAARLTEHAKLHHLMMRVVGRLADFTMLWERDRSYTFLGMLYRVIGDTDLRIAEAERTETPLRNGKVRGVPRRVGLVLPDRLREQLQSEWESGRYKRPSGQFADIAMDDLERGFVSLWSDARGFNLHVSPLLLTLLSDDDRGLFEESFVRAAASNPLDDETAKQLTSENKLAHASCHQLGRAQIRNDFAHYNVISSKPRRDAKGRPVLGSDGVPLAEERNRINLTYLVNAVRALMSYDRKLKNAISGAISDLVLEDGVVIEWQLEHDRLKKPLVRPNIETHLSMLRRERGHLGFELPQASVRYTSMVKALFDFDSGGNRARVGEGQASKRRGVLAYPGQFGLPHRIPQALFVTYPALIS